MRQLSDRLCTTVQLCVFGLFLVSCQEQGVQLEKHRVQFTLETGTAYSPGVAGIDLPENAHARISISGSNGTSLFSDHDIAVSRKGGVFVTDHLELMPGSYIVTDFMIVEDDEDLYVTPKKGAELTTSEDDALPYVFSIAEGNASTVSMQIIDVRNQDLRKFGYISSKLKATSISLAVFEKTGGNVASATAEVRQNNSLVKVLSLGASTNTIALEGNPRLPYTLTVFTANSAKTRTFNLKDLKKEIGKKPLRIVLDPALILTIEATSDESPDYEDDFEFRMAGKGAVNINWGDGEQSAVTLPFQGSHPYVTGSYTAIITGDIHQITDFSGFSYGTIIPAITGLTNLTSLKVYNPSWGAVAIKVDLSNCKQLETISISKYGAPFETIDLKTDFKLPPQHQIDMFLFDAPGFDVTREFISAGELDVMFNNVYANAVKKGIYNGRFFVNPVVTPSPETQKKIDVLVNQYNWQVGFNDEIYNAYDDSDTGGRRSAPDSDAKREQWLRDRFSNAQKIIERAHVFSSLN